MREEKEEEEEVARRTVRAALLPALAIALLLPPPATAAPPPPDARPNTVVTLDQGHLWGAPWEIIAYRSEEGLWCQTLLRELAIITCVDVQPAPAPIQVTAGFHRGGPKPTTVVVVATSREVARVRLKLVPGDVQLTHRVEPLREKLRRRAGLPGGFRFFVIALEKVRGVRSIDAFDKDGELVGHSDGIEPPPL